MGATGRVGAPLRGAPERVRQLDLCFEATFDAAEFGRTRSTEQEGHDATLFVLAHVRRRQSGPLPYWGSRWALHVMGFDPWT